MTIMNWHWPVYLIAVLALVGSVSGVMAILFLLIDRGDWDAYISSRRHRPMARRMSSRQLRKRLEETS